MQTVGRRGGGITGEDGHEAAIFGVVGSVFVAASDLAAAGAEVAAVVVVVTLTEMAVAAKEGCGEARAWCQSSWKRAKEETWM